MSIAGPELIIRCRELHDVALHTKALLHETLKAVQGRQKIYGFKERAKSAKSIWMKVHRNWRHAAKLKQRHSALFEAAPASPEDERSAAIRRQVEEHESFRPDDVLDAWGCRYITLFEDHRLDLIVDLFNKLTQFNSGSSVPVPVTMSKCTIYYTKGDGSRDRAFEIRDKLQTSDFAPRIILDPKSIQEPIRRAGYSSVHFNFEVPIFIEHPRGDTPRDAPPVSETGRFEVQVRDVFEEAWSEAEHYIFYSHKDDAREISAEEEARIEYAMDNINAFRTIVDTTREHITGVRLKVDQIRPRASLEVEIASATPRADDSSEIAKVLKGKAPEAVLEDLASAYRLLHDAEIAATNEEMRLKFSDAATKFEAVRAHLGDLRDVPVKNRGNRPVGYFVDIELANSLVFSEQTQRGALDLYARLSDAYPDDPTVRYRYARAMMLQNPSDPDGREKAYGLVKDIPTLVRSDPLTHASHWLPMGAAILTGYIHYERIKALIGHSVPGSSPLIQEELENATNATHAAVTFWDQLHKKTRESEPYNGLAYKAMSNVVYYLAHLIKRQEAEHHTIKRGEAEHHHTALLKGVLQRLRKMKPPEPNIIGSYRSLDNIMHGLVALKETDEASNTAKQLYDVFQLDAQERAGRPLEFREIAQHLNNDERNVFKRAVNVMVSNGTDWT